MEKEKQVVKNKTKDNKMPRNETQRRFKFKTRIQRQKW